MKKITLILFLFFAGLLRAHTVDVRILSTMNITALNISVHSGDYELYLDGIPQPDSLSTKVFMITVVGDSMEIRIPGDTLGHFASFKIVALDDTSSFKIKPIKPYTGTRIYDHTLEVSVVEQKLLAVNHVDIEHYVAGVVEAEAGKKMDYEYYKVQAILCRTYALAHMYRHALEGFDLCDGVHCEVYKGRPTDPNVQKAVDATKGLVIVDRNLDLITAAFSSNCGGQTTNSEDVWAVKVSYLRSVKDTFCHTMPDAYWTRKIAKDDWLNYLSMKHKYPVDDSDACYAALNMTQNTREAYYVYGNLKIPYKTIRSDWQLRSAWFSIEEGKDSVIFRGRGYGHGVGLCQEGAMRMVKYGYTYQYIIPFYFQGVELIDLSMLDFFKEE
ncbi:MAG TPA: SpoIID/LytB domain-containing protein [Bacteroidia bacterium]|nr:SpoIID/LytB domain-containing protein [Bacteroidia bacterium]